ncbi:MAG: hypothetical protein ACI9T7_001812 [Oleiphilaceae bacterium]|jgi:hypothetical protein
MAKKEAVEKEVQEPLTEEQRIAQLEKKVGSNKVFLLSIAVFLIIIISMIVTAFIIHNLKPPEDSNNEAAVALQTEVVALKQQLAGIDTKLGALSVTLPDLSNQLANTQNTILKKVMLEQEQGFQKFLMALQSGTYDLAHMVPGSRTWLDQYSEQISSSMSHSKARIKSLELLNSSAPINKEEDPFFGDDF